MDMIGPPGTHEADTRLAALRSWQQPGPEPEKKDSLLKALLPLVLSQAVDMATTENLLRQPTILGWERPRERNPLPGMQSTAGRLGWQALEAALVGTMMKKKSRLGKAARNVHVFGHTGAALGNQRNMDQEIDNRRMVMVRGR